MSGLTIDVLGGDRDEPGSDHDNEERSPDTPELNTSRRKAEECYVYFWKQRDVFSQWHLSSFNVDGTRYCCAEQYMMYMKAVMLHDDRLAKKILNSDDPRYIKSLGRQTEQFNEDLWVHNCLYVVKQGNRAKFSQNSKLKEMLYYTYPKILVEASPFDRVWGIGLDKEDQSAWNEETWDGKNLLGFILTEVRDELMCEDDIIKDDDKKVYLDKLLDELKKSSGDKKYDRVSRKNRYSPMDYSDAELHSYTDAEAAVGKDCTLKSDHSTPRNNALKEDFTSAQLSPFNSALKESTSAQASPFNSALTEDSTSAQASPFNSALTEEFTSAQASPFNSALTEESTSAQASPFNSALTEESTSAQASPFNSALKESTSAQASSFNSALKEDST